MSLMMWKAMCMKVSQDFLTSSILCLMSRSRGLLWVDIRRL